MFLRSIRPAGRSALPRPVLYGCGECVNTVQRMQQRSLALRCEPAAAGNRHHAQEEGPLRLTYLGQPIHARVLALTLEECGANVKWEPPQERRDVAGNVGVDYVALDVTAFEDEVEYAVGKFKQRLPGADVEIEEAEGRSA